MKLGSKRVDYDLKIERKNGYAYEEWGRITGMAHIDNDLECLNPVQKLFLVDGLNDEYKQKARAMRRGRRR